jgi:hypothetical protein
VQFASSYKLERDPYLAPDLSPLTSIKCHLIAKVPCKGLLPLLSSTFQDYIMLVLPRIETNRFYYPFRDYLIISSAIVEIV